MPDNIGACARHTRQALRRQRQFASHTAGDHNNPCTICLDEGKP